MVIFFCSFLHTVVINCNIGEYFKIHENEEMNKFFFFILDSLIFLETNIKNMDIWNLIWIVVCCDIIAKLLTICFKAFVTVLPCRFVPLRKRVSNFIFSLALISYFIIKREIIIHQLNYLDFSIVVYYQFIHGFYFYCILKI